MTHSGYLFLPKMNPQACSWDLVVTLSYGSNKWRSELVSPKKGIFDDSKVDYVGPHLCVHLEFLTEWSDRLEAL